MGDIVIPVFQSTGALILWLAATVLMPIVVGLVSKPNWPAAARSVMLLAASLANGLLSEALAAGDSYNWGKGIMQAVVSFVIAIAIHYGVWKPTGASGAALKVGSGQPDGSFRIPD